MPLKEYNRKRDFRKTAEPGGKTERSRIQTRFVIQKHAASRLHYDFRLELDGVLKSWAVPKGVPYRKGEKRLAVEVEDHPVSYIDFEGTIPKGQYGGGTVMVWDRGTYEPMSDAPSKELAGGKLHFRLHGDKLEGEWYLVRLRDKKQWLLIKAGEDMRPVSAKKDDSSAISGHSMKQISDNDSSPVWNGKAKAEFVDPMKAQLVESPAKGEWIYEIKFDGYRALALKNGGEVSLLSRNEKDFSGKFPEVCAAVKKLKAESATIDGEIVALDEQGRTSFQLLQQRELGERPPIFFYAFDLLELDGRDLRDEPLATRKDALEKLIKKQAGIIRFSASLEGDVKDILKNAQKLGLEGIIGKRADSTYEAGRRSGAWIKLKLLHEQEFVIGGYSDPAGSRQHFGALLVGFYKGKELKFAGKVGTGFNEKLLKSMHAKLNRIGQDRCPFANTPAEIKRSHWVKPQLVCELKFSEWTRDGKLRQPVFLGLREDKSAQEVVRETPKAT